MIRALQPQTVTITPGATAGGSTYGEAIFHFGRSLGQCEFTNGSTGAVYFRMQARNSTDGSWFSVNAVASTVSTGASVRVASTVTCVFDRLRILSTAASATTASTSFTFLLAAR